MAEKGKIKVITDGSGGIVIDKKGNELCNLNIIWDKPAAKESGN